MAAFSVPILNIVVDQCEIMGQFDGNGGGKRSLQISPLFGSFLCELPCSRRFVCQQQEGGTQQLPWIIRGWGEPGINPPQMILHLPIKWRQFRLCWLIQGGAQSRIDGALMA